MATTNLGMATPAHNSFVDTWDVPVNGNTTILDKFAGNITAKSLSASPVTLTADELLSATLVFTGTLLANVTVTLGAVIRQWNVENLTLGNFDVILTTGSGNVVGLPPGSSSIYPNGSGLAFANMQRIGDWYDYPSTAVPTWISSCTIPPYLLANGGSFSAGTYPVLNKILGGNTLPDHRGRSRFALNGGTARLTTTGGIDGDTRFAGGGDGDGLIIGQVNLPVLTALPVIIPAGQGSHFHPNSKPVDNGTSASVSGLIKGWNPPGNTDVATLPAMSGTADLGGSGTALASVPPGLVGGVVMLRAG